MNARVGESTLHLTQNAETAVQKIQQLITLRNVWMSRQNILMFLSLNFKVQ